MKSIHKMPISGLDYPSTWSQFLDWFHTEEACRAYLEKLKWPNGFYCNKCQSITGGTKTSRNRWACTICRGQTTVTSGTIFDKTRTELRVWFAAIWYVTSQKQGVSALGLQRVLGLGSYETAWTMLHRLRRAMASPSRSKLNGNVEVDETYLPMRHKVSNKQGLKSNTRKTLVAIAVEIKEPKHFGRVRIQRLEDSKIVNIEEFIKSNVEQGSSLRSDGSFSYQNSQQLGYQHQRIVHFGSAMPAHESMPGVHRVASLLQRWLLGTHHGAIKQKQLDYYLDEFVFRFNRRTSKSRGLLFYRLLSQSLITQPTTYDDIAKS